MAQGLASTGVYLIQTFFGIYIFLVMLRFLMQVSRADYYNPLCQGIVKITDPAIRPFRPLLPTVYGVDFATLGVAFVIQMIALSLIILVSGSNFPLFSPLYIAWALLALFSIIFKIYFFALIIMVISSWLAPHSSHPALTLVNQIVEPICQPARKLLPPMGGIDFSIILVFVVINVIENILVIPPLKAMLQVPANMILGL